jgi:hypothetical protein
MTLAHPLRTPFPVIAALGNDRGEAPLELCRKLIASGVDPQTPLHVYRGSVLALVIRAIGEGAQLVVTTNDQGTPVFRKLARKPAPGLVPAPPIAPTASTLAEAPAGEIAAPTPAGPHSRWHGERP